MKINKFMAWNRGINKMLPPLEIHDLMKETSLITYGRKQCTLIQFTGLKDKKGREIYEGFIIREAYSDGSGYRDFVVEWTDAKAINMAVYEDVETRWIGIHFKALANSEDYTPIDEINWSNVEVIGNIYENPELLKDGGGRE